MHPKTWEDPSHVDPNTHAKGDNDPLDVCEIGSAVGKRGEIKRVKVLGTIALIDEGKWELNRKLGRKAVGWEGV